MKVGNFSYRAPVYKFVSKAISLLTGEEIKPSVQKSVNPEL